MYIYIYIYFCIYIYVIYIYIYIYICTYISRLQHGPGLLLEALIRHPAASDFSRYVLNLSLGKDEGGPSKCGFLNNRLFS